MCLAVPGQVVSREGDDMEVDFQGTRSTVGALMTPEAQVGDWVLVHAGYAISRLDEAEARKTWEYLRLLDDEPAVED